jgi:hypothetical protein
MIDLEIDLSGIAKACEAGQHVLTKTAESAAVRAGQEGLQESKDKQRFQNRTHDLRDKADVRPVRASRDEAVVDIVWPVPYASCVDQGTSRMPAFGFAGDAALKAERVLLREVESGAEELEAVLNHNF